MAATGAEASAADASASIRRAAVRYRHASACMCPTSCATTASNLFIREPSISDEWSTMTGRLTPPVKALTMGLCCTKSSGIINAERLCRRSVAWHKVRALFRRDLDGAGRKDNADGGFTRHFQQFSSKQNQCPESCQGGQRAAVRRMHIFILSVGKLFVRLVRASSDIARIWLCTLSSSRV